MGRKTEWNARFRPGWDEIFDPVFNLLPISYAYGTFLRKRNTQEQKRNIKFKQFQNWSAEINNLKDIISTPAGLN